MKYGGGLSQGVNTENFCFRLGHSLDQTERVNGKAEIKGTRTLETNDAVRA